MKEEETRGKETRVISCDYSILQQLHLGSAAQEPYDESTSSPLNARINEWKNALYVVG